MAVFYVQESLGAGEKVVRFAHFHWFYTLYATLMIGWGMAGAALALWAGVFLYRQIGYCPVEFLSWWDCMHALHIGIKAVVLLVFAIGLWSFIHLMIVKVSTEIAVTNRRLIFKRGLVSRNVDEMNVDRIEGVEVNQGILGRIFDYGRVSVHGMGVGRIILPTIQDPVTFRKAIQWARTCSQRQDDEDRTRRNEQRQDEQDRAKKEPSHAPNEE